LTLGYMPKLGLRLIRSLPLAHPSGFVYVARFPSAPFPPGTIETQDYAGDFKEP